MGNPQLKKMQEIAKRIKVQNPKLKHTEAVALAWKEMKGGKK